MVGNTRREHPVQCGQQSALPGCNVVLLWMAQAAGYRAPRFLTFKQAVELGGNVRKGEHGTKVYFVKQLQVHDRNAEDNSATRLIPMMREYTVFNVDQCENLPNSITTGKPLRVRNPDARDGLADDFLRSTGADIREGHGEAYYVPSRDFISMPAFEAFKGADHFYNVAFHELTHWTADQSRRDRDLKNRFGSRSYAAEELTFAAWPLPNPRRGPRDGTARPHIQPQPTRTP